MSVKPVFIDTNIFVYAMQNDDKDIVKERSAKTFLENIENQVIISTQVLNEFSNVLIRNKVENQKIRDLVESIIEECQVNAIGLNAVIKAWDIRIRYNFSYWDSLIISSALLSNCSTLYSEDLQHNQRIENRLIVINPFEELAL